MNGKHPYQMFLDFWEIAIRTILTNKKKNFAIEDISTKVHFSEIYDLSNVIQYLLENSSATVGVLVFVRLPLQYLASLVWLVNHVSHARRVGLEIGIQTFQNIPDLCSEAVLFFRYIT